jgi:amidase
MQIGFATMIAGREPTEDDMEPLSWWLWQTCKSIDSVGAALAGAQAQGAARAIVTWTNGWDAVVTPGLAEAPVTHGTVDPLSAQPDRAFARSGAFTPYTALFNVTGQPAITLPLFQREDGLPLGVQVVGRPAEEGALLALAAELEEAAPGIEGRPPVS